MQKQNTLLAVYNICGISGNENVPYYVDALRSILAQSLEGKRAVVSACLSSQNTRLALTSLFGEHLSYNFIDEKLPLSVTFNHTVDKMVEKFGEFDAYLYIDSGITFWGQPFAFETLYSKHQRNGNAITAALPSNDTGFEWWGIPYPRKDYFFEIGKTTNMHCQIFDSSWRASYRRILPDIFASDTSESVFSFMAAGIGKRFMITPEIQVLHAHSMDGASSGFRGRLIFPGYVGQKDMNQIYAEGKAFGLGYEECDPQKRWVHDPSCYDPEGRALYPRELMEHCRENLFLKGHEFDYSQIKHDFFPGN